MDNSIIFQSGHNKTRFPGRLGKSIVEEKEEKKGEEELHGDGFIDKLSGNPGRLATTGWEEWIELGDHLGSERSVRFQGNERPQSTE
jgi:hypothetical protein